MRGFVFLLVLFWTAPALSDTVVQFPADGRENAVSLSAGLDYAIVTLKAGYSRALHLPKLRRVLVVDAGFSIPAMSFDIRDFKIDLGVQIEAIGYKDFRVPVSLDLLLRNTNNKTYNAFGVGTELGIYPGLYTDKLTVAAEAIWDASWAAYVTLSDYYKEVIYSDGVAGWYGPNGHVFRFGARLGGLIRSRVEIYARGGFELQGKYNAKIPPAYGIMGVSTRF